MGSNNSQGEAARIGTITLNQPTDNDQILVKLCLNGKKWLSPVGWTAAEKGTLLDCRTEGGKTILEIPDNFAQKIKAGDVLKIHCAELDCREEITWSANNIADRREDETASGALSGLLAKIKPKAKDGDMLSKSETEKRADEAERAAQSYKAKMEAATAAKEEAHRKALEAARRAEEALKMEAARIAEMERAALAFEEAEKLKQDELRRVEEERRAEEARLEEERRLAEEARQKELARQRELARLAAIKSHDAELAETKKTGKRLKSRLSELRKSAKNIDSIIVQNDDAESEIRNRLSAIEDKLSKQRKSFENAEVKLTGESGKLVEIQSKSETALSQKEQLLSQIREADAAYDQAQKAAEAAIAKADARRKSLEALRTEETAISAQVNDYIEKLETLNRRVSDSSVKTQKLKDRMQAIVSEKGAESLRLDAVLNGQEKQKDALQKTRIEIEAVRQALEDAGNKQAAHGSAIAHLQAGGDPQEIKDLSFEPITIPARIEPETDLPQDSTEQGSRISQFAGNLMGRVRSNFNRSADPVLQQALEEPVEDKTAQVEKERTEKPVRPESRVAESRIEESRVEEPVVAEAAKVVALDKPDSPELNGPEKLRKELLIADKAGRFYTDHRKGLIAATAILGGLIVLAGGLAISQNNAQTTIQASAEPLSKTDVASAVAVTTPVASVDVLTETNQEAAPVDPGDVNETQALSIEPAAVAQQPVSLPSSEPASASGEEAEALLTPEKELRPVLRLPVVEKTAELVPVQPVRRRIRRRVPVATITPAIPANEPIANETVVIDPASSETAIRENTQGIDIPALSVPVQPAPVIGQEAALTATPQQILEPAGINAQPAIIEPQTPTVSDAQIQSVKIVQGRLSDLGFYSGPVDGIKTVATDDAILNFKTLFGLAADSEINAALATALNQAGIQRVSAVPSEPVETASLSAPALSTDTPPLETAEPATQIASAPVTVAPPEPAEQKVDVIVEAEALGRSPAQYPEVALRREVYVNASITIDYDVDTNGDVINAKVATSDYTGRYADRFTQSALNAVQAQKFSPKTVNGVAELSTGHSRKITFRVAE